MVADMPLDKAAFIGLWIESILYGEFHFSNSVPPSDPLDYRPGCHTIVFLSSLYLLRNSKSSLKFNPALTAVMLTVMFGFSTTHVSINFARGLAAFVSYQETPFGASIYLKKLWALSNVMKQATYVTNVLIGDSFAIYRSYIILTDTHFKCDKKFAKLTIFPICSLISSAVCGYISVYNLSQISHVGESAFMYDIFHFRAALLGLSLVTNTSATMLVVVFIVWKSRQTEKPLVSTTQNPYRKACFSLLQFGIIIPASLTASLILYSLKMNANYIVLDSMTQIAGLVPAIVVINNHLPSQSSALPRIHPELGFKTRQSREKMNQGPKLEETCTRISVES
ncbi:MAG: hypothetical protein NXY57DRAFT_974364, partial [Lentinula lateritia]